MNVKDMTDKDIVDAFAELLNRFDGVFARGEWLPFWDLSDEEGEDEEGNETEGTHTGECARDIYLAKRTAARFVFDESGALKEIEEIDF